MLVQRHNRLFHDKWVDVTVPASKPALGDGDMSFLADLGSSFAIVRQMRIFPVSRDQLIQVTIVACLPSLPLVLLVLPFAEVLRLLFG
jgi:hypothetical protein